MTSPLSPNTEAILLLTAPLIAGKGKPSPDLLTPGQYTRLVRHLQNNHLKPADLVSPEGTEAIRTCGQVIETDRLERLLGRGFLLAQALERWLSRAIWVVSRSDPEYPPMLKSRLKNDAPSVLYGCGEVSELNSGGLAVVGSRHVDDELVRYTQEVGAFAAQSGSAIVSGGAKGIDQAAMRGALDAGGRAIGILADSLEKAVVARYNRDMLLSKQLTLLSPYDPAAGFNVGNAMRRNKLIYALSNAALIVSSDLEKGGTWTGAAEQLTKLKLVPVYVRSTGRQSDGLDGLTRKGALQWPNPANAEDFRSLLHTADGTVEETQPGLPFAEADASVDNRGAHDDALAPPSDITAVVAPSGAAGKSSAHSSKNASSAIGAPAGKRVNRLEDKLFDTVRDLIRSFASEPARVDDIATALAVTKIQAELWVERLLLEGALEKGPTEDSVVARAGKVATS
ncbi:DNA-processing protein DprA [Mycolicibacterium fortuitum]|uniref:DNA-processing protein DprA n=1 Tax=Mycolicibacterium fortuitum TaxID=1766 RepID=UPI00241E6F7C|nr:DNA-processing protein DprA [Mycolicibacterium fortuitum]MDG5769160.1 DNA-processing protein DprA [Mycolicibacterium fortuitum]MDG5779978.1 DNA-processing protein DprA [Mycolicibacterium fortuitum]